MTSLHSGFQGHVFSNLSLVVRLVGVSSILVDSAGVPYTTRMDITQISNNNDEINREVRLIYVIDRDNGMPIYFRYVAGSIIDVSTPITTVSELEQYGVSVNYAILDAGYSQKRMQQNSLKAAFLS